MRNVAITAAVFGSAFVFAPVSQLSFADAHNTKNSNTKTTATAVTQTKKPAKAELASAKKETAQVSVRVASGDNLSKLAAAHGTTYQRLFYANTSINNPDLIFPGQELRIPAADEQLTPRPLPESAPAEAKQTPAAEAAAPQPAPRAAAPAPAPAPRAAAPVTLSGDTSIWDRLAQCEAGGNWAINTGNGFYGGLQFTLSSWRAVGGTGYPHQASREEQIMRGQKLQALQGWGAWPACSAKLGLR